MLSTKLRTQNWPLYKNYKPDVSSVSPLLLGAFGGFSSGIEGGSLDLQVEWRGGGGVTRREQGVIIVVQTTRINYSFIV